MHFASISDFTHKLEKQEIILKILFCFAEFRQ